MMEQASLNIGTIGQRLEAARQAKGVSVSEAGRATKILSKFIEAMESDDFGALSAPVYAKSFIRMYAQYLGIEASPLVEEYVAQHAPKTKTQLTDEVRQNLAKVDVNSADSAEVPMPSSKPKTKRNVFSDVNASVGQTAGEGAFPVKLVVPIVGAVLVLGLIVLTATQCAGDDTEEAPAATGSSAAAATVAERPLIRDGVPDVYLVEPDVVEVD